MIFSRTIFFLFIILTGCSVGPRYIPPVVPVPLTWSTANKTTTSTLDDVAWWHHFHDPILNELIEQRALCNLDIKTAQARIQEARTAYTIAVAQLFPTLNLTALPPDGTGTTLTQVLALTASLEPDFFGKQRENKHRTQAELAAEVATHDFALLNLRAEIASSYLELREAQTKEKIFRNNLKGNKDILTFSKSGYKLGLISYLNIAQQDALIETQLAQLEQNKALIMMLLHKIEILTGNNPSDLAKQLLPYKPIPQMTQPISLGVPSELLRRRPDIIAAERRVAAAHANIRVATANLFPQITLGWLLAWQTQSLSSLILTMQNSESSFFGTFNAPLLNLTLYRMIDLRKREKALAVIFYQATVLKALHEVETQYNYCTHYKASTEHLKRAVKQKRLVLQLSRDTYKKGASNFNTVLRAEEDLNSLEASYLHNIVISQIAKINLYKALGGGYEPQSNTPRANQHQHL